MKIQSRLIGAFEALFLALSGALTIALLVTLLWPPTVGSSKEEAGKVVAQEHVEGAKRA